MSFLTDSNQATKLGFHLSSTLPINRSIRQGSGIGPTLFIMFAHYGKFSIIFTRAKLASTGISCRRMSVCLSVTSRWSTETAKCGITQTTPHESTGTLVFWCQKSRQNSNRLIPNRGVKCRRGCWKFAVSMRSVVNLARSQVYHTERPRYLFAAGAP